MLLFYELSLFTLQYSLSRSWLFLHRTENTGMIAGFGKVMFHMFQFVFVFDDTEKILSIATE